MVIDLELKLSKTIVLKGRISMDEKLHSGYQGLIYFANQIYGLIAKGKYESKNTILDQMEKENLVKYILNKYSCDMDGYDYTKFCDTDFWETEFWKEKSFVTELLAYNIDNGLILVTAIIMSWLKEPEKSVSK